MDSDEQRGGVELQIDLTDDQITRLKKSIQEGELSDYGVVSLKLVGPAPDLEDYQVNEQLRPTVFIGSSREGIDIAKAVQLNLDELCEATIWSQGVFGLGEGSLESLVNNLDDYDFAVLVLTPDDLIHSRGKTKKSPRDNVLLEIGLFIGHLGRNRTFMIYDRSASIKLPSDLAGVTLASYHPHRNNNFEASVGAACTKIEKAIKALGRNHL